MGLIAKVLDWFNGDSSKWNPRGWERWGPGGLQVCIMGAIGKVLHFGALAHAANPYSYTSEQLHELEVFYDVLRENYPEIQMWEGARYARVDIRNPLSMVDKITYIINWNDRVARTFDRDIQPMLEKTAIRLAEEVR